MSIDTQLDAARGTEWMEDAACRGADPELWFPVGYGEPSKVQTQQAKAVCRRCPVEKTCLTWAIRTGQQDGIWGGRTPEERRAIRLQVISPDQAPHQPAANFQVETKRCEHCGAEFSGLVARRYCQDRCTRAAANARVRARRRAMAAEIAEVLGGRSA